MMWNEIARKKEGRANGAGQSGETMGIELTEEQMERLEEIVQKMNKEAEMALLYDEGTPEHEKHKKVLLEYKEMVSKMEVHSQTYVQQGLLDNKDVHDFYWPDLEIAALHEKQRVEHISEKDRTIVDQEYRRQ
jgi:hypothetical protein